MALLQLDWKEIEIEYRPVVGQQEPKKISLLLTMVRGARGRRKLLGEAYARTIFQPIIHFKVFDEKGIESLEMRFLQQLIHRGYLPLRMRRMDLDDLYEDWRECDLSSLDLSSIERGKERVFSDEE